MYTDVARNGSQDPLSKCVRRAWRHGVAKGRGADPRSLLRGVAAVRFHVSRCFEGQHEAARVPAVGMQAPGFRKIEHLPHHLEDLARLIGRVPVPVVQCRDVLAFDFVNGELAEFRQHELPDQPALARDGPWLAAHLDMLHQVPLREVGDRGRVGASGSSPVLMRAIIWAALRRAWSADTTPWRPTVIRPRLAARAGQDEAHPASRRIDADAPNGPGAFNQSLSEDCLEAFARMLGCAGGCRPRVPLPRDRVPRGRRVPFGKRQ